MWGGAVCGVFQGTSTFSIFLIFPFKHSVLFLLYTLSNWPANILPQPHRWTFVGDSVNMSLEKDFKPRKSLGIRPPSPLCLPSVRSPHSECVVQILSLIHI